MTDNNDLDRAGLTRRQVLHGALAGGAALTAGGLLAACGGSSSSASSSAGSSPASTGTLKSGGSLSVGATGGGAKDTIDAHLPTADTDIMRDWNLYEPLAVRPPNFGPIEMMVAESIEPVKNKADLWVVKVRAWNRIPQRQDGHRRRRDLLAAAHPRSQEPRSAPRRSATSTPRG